MLCILSLCYPLNQVVTAHTLSGRGVYTVVTLAPFVVVNGVVASPFGGNHYFTDLYYNIVRALYVLGPTMVHSLLVRTLTDCLGAVLTPMLSFYV